MRANNLVTSEIPTIAPGTRFEKVLSLMEDSKTRILPVVEQGIYIGIINEKELLTSIDPNAVVCNNCLFAPFVREESHLFEALDIITQLNLEILPVTTSENKYLGVIDRKQLVNKLAILCNTSYPGAIILLEMRPEDYSISELSRIIEDNNYKVVNLLTYPDEDTGKIFVSIKINREDATPLLRSLERFSYQIVCCFQQERIIDETLQQKFNELMYYLEM